MSFHFYNDNDPNRSYQLYPDTSEEYIKMIWNSNPCAYSIYGIKGVNNNSISNYLYDPYKLIEYFAFKMQNLIDNSSNYIRINGFHFIYEFPQDIHINISEEIINNIIKIVTRHFKTNIILYFTSGSLYNKCTVIHFFISNAKYINGRDFGKRYISKGLYTRICKVRDDINYYIKHNEIIPSVTDMNIEYLDSYLGDNYN